MPKKNASTKPKKADNTASADVAPNPDKSSEQKKARVWLFVAYPESVPSNWIDVLTQTGCQCAISPLHDADKNADGELKKPHWHVMICFEGPTTYANVKSITDALNCPHPQRCNSFRGAYRYLTHADNPEKAQYDVALIRALNGFYIEPTVTEKNTMRREIVAMMYANNITEYADLIEMLLQSGQTEYVDIALSNTICFRGICSSLRHRQCGSLRVSSENKK